jgi:hypothetical protein
LRPGALLAAVLLVATAGCGWDEGKDLPPIVEAATPPAARLVGACGRSPGLVEAPSHGCTFFAPGGLAQVIGHVAAALASEGFAVSCSGDDSVAEVRALRGDVEVLGGVTADGTVTVAEGDPSVVNVFEPGYKPPGARPIPRGFVALRLSALRTTSSSAERERGRVARGVPCTEEGLRRQTLQGCLDGWNAVGNEAARRRARRDARLPGAEVLLLAVGPGVSRGCFVGFLARDGRYLYFRSRWRDERLAWAPPELGYHSGQGFDPEARLRGDGTLVALPGATASWSS